MKRSDYDDKTDRKRRFVMSRVMALHLIAALACIIYGVALSHHFASEIDDGQIAFLLSSFLTIVFGADCVLTAFIIVRFVNPLIENPANSVPKIFWRRYLQSISLLFAEIFFSLVILTQVRSI